MSNAGQKEFQMQTTLRDEVHFSGIGLHSGKEVKLVLKPAGADFGIVFKRTDLPGSALIPARAENVISTQLATTIGFAGNAVSTVEHLMAALVGCGIDNLLVEVNAPEVPVFDGSSEEFTRVLLTKGITVLKSPRKALRIKRLVRVDLGEKWGMVYPSERFEVASFVEWAHPAIGRQEFEFIQGKTRFSEISSARTFGFLKEVEALRARGLALGGSLNNAVVLDEKSVLNPEGLRFEDEFVRHKVLDAIGDFGLSGCTILGRFELFKAGHELHRLLLEKIFADAQNYEYVNLPKAVGPVASVATKKSEKTGMVDIEPVFDNSRVRVAG